MSKIFMVAANTVDAGNEIIFGFYPSLKLAEKRKSDIEKDPSYTGDVKSNDFSAFVVPVEVTETGADTYIALR